MPRENLTTVAPEPQEDGTIHVEVTIPVRQRRRETSQNGEPGAVSKPEGRPQSPRITRLMALAIKFQDMVDRGEVRDYADLASLGYVSRARVTQIMNLLLLAPDIQEEILGLDSLAARTSIVAERHARSLVRIVAWEQQRREWITARRKN